MSLLAAFLSFAVAGSHPADDPSTRSHSTEAEGWGPPGGGMVQVDCRRRSRAQDIWIAEQGAVECDSLLLQSAGPVARRPLGVRLFIDAQRPDPELVRWAAEQDVAFRLSCDRPLPAGIEAVECLNSVEDWTHVEAASASLRRATLYVASGPGPDLPQLTDLYLVGYPPDGLHQVFIPRSLKHLAVGGFRLVPEDFGVLSGLDLVSLELRGKIPGDVFDVIGGMKSLQHLDVSGSLVFDHYLAPLIGLEALEEIRLDRTVMTNHGMEHLAKIQSLRAVHVEGTEVGDQGVASLASLPALEALTLGEGVTDSGVAHLAAAKRLRWLDLQETRLQGTGLVALSGLSLRYLDVTPAEVGPVAEAVGHLRELWVLRFRAEFLPHDGYKSLKRLTRLRGLYGLRQGLPTSFYPNFKRLRRLDLREFHYEARKWEPSSIAALRELRHLRLGPEVDDRALAVLDLPASLRRLDLDHTTLSNKSVGALAGLHDLRVLELVGGHSTCNRGGGCTTDFTTSIDSASLARLNLPELRVLKLQFVPLEDPTAALWLKLPHLDTLSVQDGLLTDEVFAQAQASPRLRVLQIWGASLTHDAREEVCTREAQFRCQ